MPTTTYNYDRSHHQASVPAWIWIGLICVVLVLLASTCAGCRNNGGGNGWQATQTYGASEYFAQETEIAKP